MTIVTCANSLLTHSDLQIHSNTDSGQLRTVPSLSDLIRAVSVHLLITIESPSSQARSTVETFRNLPKTVRQFFESLRPIALQFAAPNGTCDRAPLAEPDSSRLVDKRAYASHCGARAYRPAVELHHTIDGIFGRCGRSCICRMRRRSVTRWMPVNGAPCKTR